MQSSDYPDLPFVHARGDGGPRSATRVVIIHSTENPNGASAAQEAGWASRNPQETSAHYYVDSGQVVQAVPVGNIAYGAMWHGNQISVQYELCNRAGNAVPDGAIVKAAGQIARDCLRYNIPIRRISAAQVRAGERGICGHDTITAAFPEDDGDHSDPGRNFPWDRLIALVQQAAAPNPQPPVPPQPQARTITVAKPPNKPWTMWQVAEAAYGAGSGKRWQEIWYAPANAAVRDHAGNDPSRIQPGWKITIP